MLVWFAVMFCWVFWICCLLVWLKVGCRLMVFGCYVAWRVDCCWTEWWLGCVVWFVWYILLAGFTFDSC